MTIAPAAQMELSRQKAREFATKWATQKTEKQLAQSFWADFFHLVVGIDDLMATGIEFEHPIKNVTTGTTNFIDVLWSGIVLIEHKSAGKNLDVAEKQARDYLISLPAAERPPTVIISDFARIRVIEVLAGNSIDFDLADLPKHLDRFDAIFQAKGKNSAAVEVLADKRATDVMAALYVEFEKQGYEGHEVSVLLIRILFLLFGDDTRMWKAKLFEDFVKGIADPNALGGRLAQLFQTLNTPKDKRPANLDSALADFPYVNGGLFAENLQVFSFTEDMRDKLVTACEYHWSEISPAIFGAMFQTIKSKEARRALGEHYTSEANILKVIRPLFLDDFLDRMRKGWDDRSVLRALLKDMASKRYLDPAAGSGNFLVVAYKRLRETEHKILARLVELEGRVTSAGDGGFNLQVGLDGTIGLSVTLEQFHAIEYEEWSSQIASVAMFLTDHQANLALEELTGLPPNRFPLTHSATVKHGNALEVEWNDVCPIDDNTIIMGNPPFYGSTWLSPEQKQDQLNVWGDTKNSGILDYVASWYLVAAKHMKGTKAKAAFVSTNSITQGQQPPVLWGALYPLGMKIDFAHRTFAWDNQGGKNAAVHVVVIGFSANPKPTTVPLWSYATVHSEPELVKVRNINAYLLDADDILITSRNTPLQDGVQEIINGCKPVDGGWLSNISPEEAEKIRKTDPLAAKYLRKVIGAEEFINGIDRYGLWLVKADPSDIAKSPVLKERIEAVRQMRLASTKDYTKDSAARSAEWQQAKRQPKTDYLAVPAVSSYDRDYVPIGLISVDVIANNLLSLIPSASKTTFGVLTSKVFKIWTMSVSGRMKSDPRISNEITYNNFPFPEIFDEKVREKIEKAADEVVAARELYPDSSLAVLYNRNAMPSELKAAHVALDKAVLNAYGLKANASDIGILEKLFAQYSSSVNGLLAVPVEKKRRR